MSLDVCLSYERKYPCPCPHGCKAPIVRGETVYEFNITHNVAQMAGEAGLYDAMWAPEKLKREGGESLKAGELVPFLEKGLAALEADPDKFRALNPKNGWGNYDNLLDVVRGYLEACRECPEAEVSVWR